jgi:hypothetical protein
VEVDPVVSRDLTRHSRIATTTPHEGQVHASHMRKMIHEAGGGFPA